jgi:hypothetical protein
MILPTSGACRSNESSVSLPRKVEKKRETMKQHDDRIMKKTGAHLRLVSDTSITTRVSHGRGVSKSEKSSLKDGIMKMTRRLLTRAAVEITHNG